MRRIVVLCLAVLMPALCYGQSTSNSQSPDDLKVVRATWRYAPFGVLAPIKADAQGDLSRSDQTVLRSDGQTNRVARDPEDQREATRLVQMRGNNQLGPLPEPRPAGRNEAVVDVRNDGPKAIKAVSYNFLFVNPKTGGELLYYRFRHRVRIRAGETKTLTNSVVDHPSHAVDQSAVRVGTTRLVGAEYRVEIMRIEYADGSVWRRR